MQYMCVYIRIYCISYMIPSDSKPRVPADSSIVVAGKIGPTNLKNTAVIEWA